MYTITHAQNTALSALQSIDLALEGSLDAASVLAVRRDCAVAASNGPILVLLDVTEVTSIGASGVVGLLEVLHLLRARGGDVRLFGSSGALDDTNLQAHLGHVARIYATRQAAVDGGTPLVRVRRPKPRFRLLRFLLLRFLPHSRRAMFGWG
ncbi:STAS domain-containing protein [Paenarthrobacter sp. S56]|uniref:STAS domain-containing protein n=1 Tax=Paenarthrobacter sp. S56 TaxID=3138179 RepID=UPI0032193677